ncbi:hypothetical protein AAHZ94_12070 [Streptomyces sp. HSW2009]
MTAERLAALCAHLAEIREILQERLGGDETLAQLLAAAQDGGDLSEPLAVLHAVLQADGDPQGLDGYSGTGPGTRSLRPAGISPQSGELVYVCPASRCTRYWWPQATTSVPHCALSGTSLRRERL